VTAIDTFRNLNFVAIDTVRLPYTHAAYNVLRWSVWCSIKCLGLEKSLVYITECKHRWIMWICCTNFSANKIQLISTLYTHKLYRMEKSKQQLHRSFTFL